MTDDDARRCDVCDRVTEHSRSTRDVREGGWIHDAWHPAYLEVGIWMCCECWPRIAGELQVFYMDTVEAAKQDTRTLILAKARAVCRGKEVA